jgi:hypothetical protein
MTLREKRCRFTELLVMLIDFINSDGYECCLNEVYRDPRIAKLNAQSGAGVVYSNHLVGLAADINLYKDGVYLDKSDDHKKFGEYWESLSTSEYTCCWGGRFSKPDGNHYSMEHNGVE